MRYFVTGHEMLLYLSGDREEHKEECCFELPDFESKEEAVAAAREFIKEHKNAVNDQKHGIGSVTYWTAEVTRCIHFYYGDELKPDDSFFKPKRRRKVRCTETGVVYESIKDAAERTKISPNGIGSAASGMAGGYHWEYADD